MSLSPSHRLIVTLAALVCKVGTYLGTVKHEGRDPGTARKPAARCSLLLSM